MRRRPGDDSDEEPDGEEAEVRASERRPSRRRRPARSASRGIPVFLIVLLVMLPLLVGGGLLVFFLVLQPKEELAKARKRFLGEWQATAPEATSLKLHLKVTRDDLVLTGTDSRSGLSGSEKMTWKVVQLKKGILTVHLHRLAADKDTDWSVEFESDSRMKVRTVGADIPTRVYTRLGKSP